MIRKLILACLLFAMVGCSAAQVALTKKDLDVQTKMSNSLFLEVDDERVRTVYIDVHDTSGKHILLRSTLTQALERKGYTVVSQSKKANYILQVNVLFCEKTAKAAVEKTVGLGYAGTIGAGVATGALIGTATRSPYGVGTGAVVGGLTGAVTELVAGSLVKDVTYALVTDIKISERLKSKTKVHTSRMAATANQVNLSFEDAKYALEDATANSLAGIF